MSCRARGAGFTLISTLAHLFGVLRWNDLPTLGTPRFAAKPQDDGVDVREQSYNRLTSQQGLPTVAILWTLALRAHMCLGIPDPPNFFHDGLFVLGHETSCARPHEFLFEGHKPSLDFLPKIPMPLRGAFQNETLDHPLKFVLDQHSLREQATTQLSCAENE